MSRNPNWMNHYFFEGVDDGGVSPSLAGSLFLKAGFFCNRL